MTKPEYWHVARQILIELVLVVIAVAVVVGGLVAMVWWAVGGWA